MALSFDAFMESWFVHLGQLRHDLLEAISNNGEGSENEDRCKDVITRTMSHYSDYFVAKARVVEENVFLVLAPPWLSAFERSYLWIGGFKPGLALRIVINNVKDLSDDQSRRMNELMIEIREEENEISNEFNRIQDIMPYSTTVELARRVGMSENGVRGNMEVAFDIFRESMMALVECTDFSRKKVAIMIMDILECGQAARFLASVAHLQLEFRRWGMLREDGSRRAVAA